MWVKEQITTNGPEDQINSRGLEDQGMTNGHMACFDHTDQLSICSRGGPHTQPAAQAGGYLTLQEDPCILQEGLNE